MLKNKGFISILATLILALGSLVALGTYVDSDQYKSRVGDGVNTISSLPGRVKVSSNDTTMSYLENKLVAGDNISLTTNNDGGNETITIDSTGGGGGAWGSITGTLSDQTDLQTELDGKQDTITTGTTAQYFRGDLSLATFPTNLSDFTNDSGFITGVDWGNIVPNSNTQNVQEGGSLGIDDRRILSFSGAGGGISYWTMASGNPDSSLNPLLGVFSETQNSGMDFQAAGSGNYNFRGTTGDGIGIPATINLFENEATAEFQSVGLSAPDNLDSGYNLTFPSEDPTDGAFIQTDSAGILSWITSDAMPFVHLSGDETVAGVKTFSSNIKTSAGNCTDSDEYCQKAYIDSFVQGLSPKASVRVATTVAGTLATSFENGDTIDGVVLATGNRILIKNQASSAENGIYTVNASGAPTRGTDYDAAGEINQGTFASVLAGTVNMNTIWVMYEADVVTVNTDPINFSQLAQPNTYTFTDDESGTNFDLETSGFNIIAHLPVADGTNTGKLSNTDWTSFDGKIDGAGTVTDETIVLFDGTDGKTVKQSGLTILDDGVNPWQTIMPTVSSDGIYIRTDDANNASDLNLLAGNSVSGATGGVVTITSGDGDTGGGAMTFTTGSSSNTGAGGDESHILGDGSTNTNGGSVTYNLGEGFGTGDGGNFNIVFGNGSPAGKLTMQDGVSGNVVNVDTYSVGSNINASWLYGGYIATDQYLSSNNYIQGPVTTAGNIPKISTTNVLEDSVYAINNDPVFASPAIMRPETNGAASPFIIRGASSDGFSNPFSPGGTVQILGGEVDDNGSFFQTGGGVEITAANGNPGYGSVGGAVTITAGSTGGSTGGNVTIKSGEASNASSGGDLILTIGGGLDGFTSNGNLKIQAWDDAGPAYRTATMDFNNYTSDHTVTWQDGDGTVAYLSDVVGGGSAVWGTITGTLSSQTDLQNALDLKVTGPATATDNAIARYNTTTGELIQDSGILVGDSDGQIEITAPNDAMYFSVASALDNIIFDSTPSGGNLEFYSGKDMQLSAADDFSFIGNANGGGVLMELGMDQATGSNAGANVLLYSGEGGPSGGAGGDMDIFTGGAHGGNTAGGELRLTTGDGFGTGDGGDFEINAGNGGSGVAGQGGRIFLTGGDGGGGNSSGGIVSLAGGNGTGTGSGANIQIFSGLSGNGATGNTGDIYLYAGDAQSTNGSGGGIIFEQGASTGTGTGKDMDFILGSVSTGTAGKFDFYQPKAGAEVLRLRTSATNLVSERMLQGTVTTTNATVTTILTIPMASFGTGVHFVEFSCLAVNTGTPATTNTYHRFTKVETTAGTTGSLTTTNTVTNEDAAAWDCTAATSGTNLLIQATGAAATNIRWTVYARAMSNF